MTKLKVKLIHEDSQFVKVKLYDRFGKERWVRMHGYLVGMEAAFALKKQHSFHNLVIITGAVGSGKSTLTQGVAALNSAVGQGKGIDFENISWATEKFIEKTDQDDNIGTPQIWDESIQGASARNMAITNMGNKLKMAFVTKRFKKHTYYLIIDEINEYAWKLIKMADAWIHVRKFYLQRGYFDVYTNKKKIKYLYNLFKFHYKDWGSPEVKKVTADCRGKYDDFTDLFLDDEEYNKRKLEETRQLEIDDKLHWAPEKALAFGLWFKGGLKQREIGEKVGLDQSTIARYIPEFKKIMHVEK